jgi:glycosyltransferase involved in cell wall biosynthesis
MKLAIVTSHPIQYYSPWFKYMSDYVDLHVFYMHQESKDEKLNGEFGISHDWDIDLLDGYKYIFLNNVSKNPSVNSFKGCDIPDIYIHIKEGKFDAVLVLGWYLKGFWQTILACKIYKTPIMVRGDSQLSSNLPIIKKIIKKFIYTMMLRVFDIILYVGKNNRKYLKYYGVNDDKIHFCPHFIDQNFFYVKSRNTNITLIRQNIGIDKDSYILLFVGKLIEKKRPLDILQAMNILTKQNIQVELILIGSGELENELKTYAEGNSKLKIHFLGFKNQTELPLYYSLADLLILPSDTGETWGLVVNESFATLTPAIVSDQVGCAPDLIDKGLTGDVFECCNPVDLAKKIKNFIKNFNSNSVESNIQGKNRVYSMEYATNNLIEAINSLKVKSYETKN